MARSTLQDLGEFAKSMDRRALNVTRNVDLVIKKIAATAHKRLIERTPVDKGRAISNWIVSLDDELPIGMREAFVPGRYGSTVSENSIIAMSEGMSVIRSRRTGQDIYIVNYASYIKDLNQGSSAQAPANFVAQAVREAVNSVAGAKILEDVI